MGSTPGQGRGEEEALAGSQTAVFPAQLTQGPHAGFHLCLVTHGATQTGVTGQVAQAQAAD